MPVICTSVYIIYLKKYRTGLGLERINFEVRGSASFGGVQDVRSGRDEQRLGSSNLSFFATGLCSGICSSGWFGGSN